MSVPARARVEFDPRIHDSAFLEEIDLYSELMIVAAASAGSLTTDAIDRALGLVDALFGAEVLVVLPPDPGLLTILAG